MMFKYGLESMLYVEPESDIEKEGQPFWDHKSLGHLWIGKLPTILNLFLLQIVDLSIFL